MTSPVKRTRIHRIAPLPAPDPSVFHAENEALRTEAERLRNQVKTLVRTEGKLYKIQEQLDVQIKIVSKLYELGMRMNATFDVEEILAEIPAFVLYDLGYQRVATFLADRDDGIRLRASDGYYDNGEWSQRLAQLVIGRDAPIVQRLTADRKVVHSAAVPLVEVTEFASAIGMERFIAYPFFAEDRLIGFLCAGNTAAEEQYHVAVDGDTQSAYGLANLAGQTAAAINKALLYWTLAEERNLLERKVQDRTQELSRAYENLEHLNSLKSQFFANVSHELRTPLTLSIAPLEELLNRPGSHPETQRRHLAMIYDNQLRLLKLINNLLDFSKIDAGRMTATFQREDVIGPLRYYAGILEPAMQTRGMSISFETNAEQVELYIDPDKFEKIFMNLLSNAYKFTPDGGRIAISVRHGETATEIDVADSGIGIAPEALPTIFERFSQIDATEKRRYEGTGIGLAMVEEFIHLHGGTVTVRSTPGAGTVFTVLLRSGAEHLPPSAVLAGSTAELETVRATHLVDFRADVREPEPTETAEPVVSPAAHAVLRAPLPGVEDERRATVLVVDDVADMRTFITHLLSEKYTVVTARDGLEGLEKARALMPDIVVSDVMMPRMTGFELLDALRSSPGGALARMPVILLSARADVGKRLEGLDHGADDYLIKPFNANELLTRVANLIRLRRQERELAVAFERLEERDALITADLRQAREFQQSILPPAPSIRELNIDVCYLPANLVGGDFYDVALIGMEQNGGRRARRVRTLLADVTGHGVKASLATMLVKSEFDRLKYLGAGPARVLQAMNQAILGSYERLGLRFTATCVDVDLDTGEVWHASAAHPAPFIVRAAGGPVEELPAGGTFIGLMPRAEYPEHFTRLNPGDHFMVYTDGFTEEWDHADEEFGVERLFAATAAAAKRGESLSHSVLQAVHSFIGEARSLRDDATCIALRWQPLER